MAAPSFSAFIKNNRLTTQINALSAAINLTRSEAIKRADEVILCASSNQSTCNGTGWEEGWIIYSDTNDNGSIESSEIISVHDAIPESMTLERNNDLNVVIEPTGYANASEASTFFLCDDRGADYGRGVALSINGKPTLKSSLTSCS
jgi:type IV fimbrial biogenesis protein FimT